MKIAFKSKNIFKKRLIGCKINTRLRYFVNNFSLFSKLNNTYENF